MQADTLLPGSILSLSGEAADRLLSLGDGDAALAYLCLLRRGGPEGLGWPAGRLQSALDRLSALKLALPGQAAPPPEVPPEPEEPPQYTQADIAAALERGGDFPGLVGEMERRLGKKLSTADLKTLYTLYDHLAMPPEVILLAAAWCEEEVRRRYGPGRKPFLSQIRVETFRWARQGVDSAETAEEHLKKLQRLRSREGELIRLLDLPQRALVDREKKYIAAWLDMGFDDGALRMAYEKTVMGTASKSMDWRYMNGILRRWHEKGLHTAEQIRSGDAPPARRWEKTPPAPAQGPDRQAREDMERVRRLMRQMKQEEG